MSGATGACDSSPGGSSPAGTASASGGGSAAAGSSGVSSGAASTSSSGSQTASTSSSGAGGASSSGAATSSGSPTSSSGTSTSSSGAVGGSSGAADASADSPRGSSGSSGSSSGDAGTSGSGAGFDDASLGTMDGGLAFNGPTMAGTVTVNRAMKMGALAPGFAGFSFEKTHMSDGFFTATNAPLIALFKLLGPGLVRIGANDVDTSTWVAGAAAVTGGSTSTNIGTIDVDALAGFLTATGWKAIYGVSMKDPTQVQPSTAEVTYVTSKLGASLHSVEIGNEISFFGSNALGTPQMQWEAFETSIRGAVPTVPLAGAGVFGAVTTFTLPFITAEASKLVLVTQHYYKGAASSNPKVADLLAIDPSVATTTQQIAMAAQTSKIADGFRWGEMNSYSGHGAMGVSDVFASALWSIDFMLTTAEYGAAGVNFHGGGQNMDGNTCTNGVASCIKPFRYSPIDEVDAQVTAAAPLYYGMLLVSRAGTGTMYQTAAQAGSLAFDGYSVGQADGSTSVVLLNKDATSGVNASVDVGTTVTAADATYLLAPSLTSTTGVTLSGASVTPAGAWNPLPPYTLSKNGNVVTVVVPPASAVIVHAH